MEPSCFRKYSADGRLAVAIALAVYYIAFLIGIYKYNANIMGLHGFALMYPRFADLRVITAAYDSADLGYVPRFNNPCDSWGRPFNYPKIWMVFSHFGITQDHTTIIGLILALVFYISFIFLIIPKINIKTAVIYILAVLSSAVTLAVERANNDLVIFIILAFALLGLRKNKTFLNIISYWLMLLAAMLKLYSVCAAVVFLKEKKKLYLITFVLFIFIFSAYFVLTYEDLRIISKNIEVSIYHSYGNMVIFNYGRDLITDLLHGNTHLTILLSGVVCLILSLITIISAAICSNHLKQGKMYLNHNYINSFRIGGSIYIGTFLLGSNFDYRLIFLLFCIPQLIEWANSKIKASFSNITLLLVLFSLWSILWVNYEIPLLVLAKEAVNWGIFFCLTSLLLLTSPEWLRRLIGLKARLLRLNGTKIPA